MTATFGIIVIAMSVYGALANSVILDFFLNTSPFATFTRSTIALLLFAYCFSDRIRTFISHKMIILLGLSLVIVGVGGLFWPNFFSYIGLPRRLLDVFFEIELGILSVLVALERPTLNQKPVLGQFTINRPKSHEPTNMTATHA